MKTQEGTQQPNTGSSTHTLSWFGIGACHIPYVSTILTDVHALGTAGLLMDFQHSPTTGVR